MTGTTLGFFKKFKKIAKRAIVGVATGGTSELIRATGIAPGFQDIAESVLAPTNIGDFNTASGVFTQPGQALGAAISGNQPVGPSGGAVVGTNFLGGIQGLLGTVGGFGGGVGTIANLGSGFLSGFLPAQGPVAGRPITDGQFGFRGQQVMAPSFRSAAGAVITMATAALQKLSNLAGKNVTLRAAMIVIRRLAKILGSPTAVALALGLSLGELQTIITENALRGSTGRRMNPGNVKALRRAQRRLKSFHKLCTDTDTLRRTRRRSAPKQVQALVCK